MYFRMVIMKKDECRYYTPGAYLLNQYGQILPMLLRVELSE